MITLNASGGSVTFTFSGNSTYLNDGTITVPVNSLALIIDESDFVTFKKSHSNDIFVSANIAEFGMTKAELESWFKANAVGSTGGGGGVTSGEVQTMIDEAVSGKANSSDVTEEISAAVSGKVDTTTYTAYTADTTPKVDAAWQQGIRNPYLYFDNTSGITLQYSVLSGGNWSYDSLPTDDSIWYSKTGNSVNVLGVYATGATRTVNVNPSEINQRVYLTSIPPSINMYWNASYTGSTTHYIAVSCTVNDGTNGYCQWNWDGSQYVPNSDYINTAVTLSYDSTNQVVTITPSSSSALTSIIYVRCNRNIAPSSSLTQEDCRIGAVTIDTNSYKLQEALDNKVDTNTYTAYTANTQTVLNSKLDATAYTPVQVSTAITENDTNAVAGGAVYDKVHVTSGNGSTTLLTFATAPQDFWLLATNYPSGVTKFNIEFDLTADWGQSNSTNLYFKDSSNNEYAMGIVNTNGVLSYQDNSSMFGTSLTATTSQTDNVLTIEITGLSGGAPSSLTEFGKTDYTGNILLNAYAVEGETVEYWIKEYVDAKVAELLALINNL